MASDLRIRVGGASATITLNGANDQLTDAQVANILERFAISLGIPIEGTANQRLTAVLEHIRDDVRRRAKQVQATELRAANEATITSTVENDNAL